jgi:hypothetical protein
VPFALPAAGLPIWRGGNALAVRAEHFLATSAVRADALFVVEAAAMQINPAHPRANFVLTNTAYLPTLASN